MQIPLAIYLDLLHRPVCVGPGLSLEYMFCNDAAYNMLKHLYLSTPLALYLDQLHSLVCVGPG